MTVRLPWLRASCMGDWKSLGVVLGGVRSWPIVTVLPLEDDPTSVSGEGLSSFHYSANHSWWRNVSQNILNWASRSLFCLWEMRSLAARCTIAQEQEEITQT